MDLMIKVACDTCGKFQPIRKMKLTQDGLVFTVLPCCGCRPKPVEAAEY